MQLNTGMKEAIVKPTEAIKPLDKKKIVAANNISEQQFAHIVKEVYAVMLDYSRIRQKRLNKKNPLLIGNVSFWFDSDPKTKEPQLKFSHSVKAWDEKAIIRDLDQYLHDLYYNTVTR